MHTGDRNSCATRMVFRLFARIDLVDTLASRSPEKTDQCSTINRFNVDCNLRREESCQRRGSNENRQAPVLPSCHTLINSIKHERPFNSHISVLAGDVLRASSSRWSNPKRLSPRTKHNWSTLTATRALHEQRAWPIDRSSFFYRKQVYPLLPETRNRIVPFLFLWENRWWAKC